MSIAAKRLETTSRPVDREALQNLCVYLVNQWYPGNDRVQKIASLREHFRNLVFVARARDKPEATSENLRVRSRINPTGILRLFGLSNLKHAIDRYLFFPSTDVLFVRAVRHQVARAVGCDLRNGHQVCLITTAPPHALGLVGLYVKKRYPQVHWIIDWQDLWSYDENYYELIPNVYRPAARRLERRFLDEADMNVTTNAYAAAVLQDVYAVDAAHVTHIHHHFDHSDISQEYCPRSSNLEGGTRRLGFFGTLFKPPRVPGSELVDAIANMRRAGIDVELHVHGNVSQRTGNPKDETRGLFLHGRVSHAEGVKQLLGYDFLLLFLADLANCKAVMSIKLPHYLMTGRPIIAIVPKPSAIADIVERTGSGFVVPVAGNWPAELQEILEGKRPLPQRNRQAIEEFSWPPISKRWLDVIGRAVILEDCASSSVSRN